MLRATTYALRATSYEEFCYIIVNSLIMTYILYVFFEELIDTYWTDSQIFYCYNIFMVKFQTD